MRLHPRYNIVRKAEMAWWDTESGQSRYDYADLFSAFLTNETYPCLVEEPDMVDALRQDFRRVCEEQDLTPGEQAMLISAIIGDNAKYVIRYERHGNYETKGGEAG